MARVLILLFMISFSVYMTEQAYFLEKDFIEKINKEVTTWKAGINFHPKTPKVEILKLLGSRGVQIPNKLKSHMYKTHDVAYNLFDGIPNTFDAREEWKHCKTIGEVLDQGNCGSCWAMATSSAFSDRLCIATDGKFNQLVSADELTFCCNSCGHGCYGGYPMKAWKYFYIRGLVTGGKYDTKDGCQPYRVPPCEHYSNGTKSCTNQRRGKIHRCKKYCYGDDKIEYEPDHQKTRDWYQLTYTAIQKDIMAYGPVVASYDVYDDFINYKSGVYIKSENAKFLGGHAVKLIGWGEESGVPYWLMLNSWNENWGDNGTFKIRRGTNECGIDNSTTAGVPVGY